MEEIRKASEIFIEKTQPKEKLSRLGKMGEH
jgi:hypothetical protein